MNIKEEFDERMAKKEGYLTGKLSADDYAKWLNDFSGAPKLIIPAKKVIFDPNLAFRKKKGRETQSKSSISFSEIIEARMRREEKKIIPEGKYKWMDHINDDDDDIPF